LATSGDRNLAIDTCCGVATAMSQGSSRVPPPSSDQQVNTGTTSVCPGGVAASDVRRAGHTVGRPARGGTEPP